MEVVSRKKVNYLGFCLKEGITFAEHVTIEAAEVIAARVLIHLMVRERVDIFEKNEPRKGGLIE